MSNASSADIDLNVVELWLTKDVTRWKAGIFGGMFAGIAAQFVGGIVSVLNGYQFLFPTKLMAAAFCGQEATNYNASLTHLLVGFLFFEIWGALWGFVYSHFVRTNVFSGLFWMGIVWGLFTWIFNWNLLFQSFRPVRAAMIPSSAAMPVCLAFGLGMMSIGVFDRVFRGRW